MLIYYLDRLVGYSRTQETTSYTRTSMEVSSVDSYVLVPFSVKEQVSPDTNSPYEVF